MSTQVRIDVDPQPFRVGVGHIPGGPVLCASLLRKAEALRSLSFFCSLSEIELCTLAEAALVRRFERGRTIHRGGAGHDFIILLKGRAKTSIPRGTAAGEFVFGVYEDGDLLTYGTQVGELGAAMETIAIEDSSVVFLPRCTLLAFLERHPRVSLRFLEALSDHLHRVMSLAARNSCLEVGDRLYRKLAELSATRGVSQPGGAIRIEHGLHQSELAANIGASREAVNRQLASWRSRSLVEAGRGFVLVKDPRGLSMAVSSAVRDSSFVAADRSPAGA